MIECLLVTTSMPRYVKCVVYSSLWYMPNITLPTTHFPVYFYFYSKVYVYFGGKGQIKQEISHVVIFLIKLDYLIDSGLGRWALANAMSRAISYYPIYSFVFHVELARLERIMLPLYPQ